MNWKWRLRTVLMFTVLTTLLAAVGWIIGYSFNSPVLGLAFMTVLAVMMIISSTLFSKKQALRSNRVKLVTEAEEPRLYRIVRNVSMMANIPMPEVGITNDYMPNAFATGRGPSDAAVVATRGLLDMLNDEELEGVIAHEISHVKNRDIFVMSVAASVSAIIAYLARFAMYATMFSNNDNRNPLMSLVAVVGYMILPFAALLVQLGISRNREYLADESAARLTRKPDALANALIKIEQGCSSPRNNYNNPAYGPVWISNPEGRKKSLTKTLFSTHPDTKDRIKRLSDMAAEYGRYVKNYDYRY